ncbi:MAG: hypothetical protein HYU03_06775 [Thaumarchaeota archaeon]|nr:hypothetical protein [Nitrososphaerota archaeon]
MVGEVEVVEHAVATLKFEVVEGGKAPKEEPDTESRVLSAWICELPTLLTVLLYVVNELKIETSAPMETIMIRTKNSEPTTDETAGLLS